MRSLFQTHHCIMWLDPRGGSFKKAFFKVGSIHCWDALYFFGASRFYQRSFICFRCLKSTCDQSFSAKRYITGDAHRQRSRSVATDEILQKGRDLLKPDLFPLGSFSTEQYSTVKLVLYHFINLQEATTKEDVNLPIDILLRLVNEVAHNIPKPANNPTDRLEVHRETHAITNVVTYEWLLNASYYNPIFTTWKNASLKNRIFGIYTGLDVMQKIQQMSRALPPSIFKYNMYTVTMILQVIIKQVRRDEAPVVAEKMLDLMHQQLQIQTRYVEQDEHRSATWQKEVELCQPNHYVLSILLKAWAESRLDNAPEKVEAIRAPHFFLLLRFCRRPT
jgi:hypothetical protein